MRKLLTTIILLQKLDYPLLAQDDPKTSAIESICNASLTTLACLRAERSATKGATKRREGKFFQSAARETSTVKRGS